MKNMVFSKGNYCWNFILIVFWKYDFNILLSQCLICLENLLCDKFGNKMLRLSLSTPLRDNIKCLIKKKKVSENKFVENKFLFKPSLCAALNLYIYAKSIIRKTFTVIFLSFQTDRSGQTVQTQIRLEQSDQGLHCLQRLLQEQSDQGLHRLPFPLHLLDALL